MLRILLRARKGCVGGAGEDAGPEGRSGYGAAACGRAGSEDVKRDLASGNVTMEAVEKHVRLDVETGKAVIDFSNSYWPNKRIR